MGTQLYHCRESRTQRAAFSSTGACRRAARFGAMLTGCGPLSTLRDDDDSGAPWTATFTHGCEGRPAVLRGAALFMEPGLGYPFVAITGREEDRTVGRLLSWTSWGSAAFKQKLRQADDIEDVDRGLYDRRVATFRPTPPAEAAGDARGGADATVKDTTSASEAAGVSVEVTGVSVEAHFYFQTAVPDTAVRVPGGDWLRRGDVA